MFSPRLWGSRSLAPLFPDKANLKEPLGEAWLTGVECRFASDPFRGKMLGEAWKQMPAEWRGTRLASCKDFPILVKFIFPKDKLSIQVHPDDVYATAHEQSSGGRGKTEMWHVVSAEPGARLLAGLKPGVTKEKFCAALANHALEDLFQSHDVRAGDTFFIPAGLPHTIGPGMILCEVQEYSDLTYRVYDYGRTDANGKPRELHIDKALAVMNFGATRGGKISSVTIPAARGRKMLLASCPYFTTERWDLQASEPIHVASDRFELLIVLSGRGLFDWDGTPLPYQPGQCWFLPAALKKISVQPEQSTVLVRTYVPDLLGLYRELREAGIPEAQLAEVVFA
jgi:mannose-6-phosphate isomerase